MYLFNLISKPRTFFAFQNRKHFHSGKSSPVGGLRMKQLDLLLKRYVDHSRMETSCGPETTYESSDVSHSLDRNIIIKFLSDIWKMKTHQDIKGIPN